MSTLSPIPHQRAENAEADTELQAYRRCQTKFQTLRPVLDKYTEQKMEISERWKFQLLCIQYVFKCEAQEEDSFFDYVLSPEGEVVEEEAFEVFDAIYTALEERE